MQQLYVVGFKVDDASGSGTTSAFDRLLSHMEAHVSPATTGLSVEVVMAQKGEVVIPSHLPSRPDQRVTWTPITASSSVRALRMEIEQDLPKGGRFVCQLTASEFDGTTAFRVAMGRKSGGILAPATVEALKPPRALNTIMSDPELRRMDGTDSISSTVMPVLTAEVGAVRERLEGAQRRLPILVVSSIRMMGAPDDFARKAARRLAGLAHVVVVSGWLAFDSFNANIDQNLLPRDGARLYWPTTDARNPWWGAAELYGDHEALLGKIIRLLAPLSVVARGRDRLWDAVRSAETNAILESLAGEAESEQVSLLMEKLEEERNQTIELLEKNEALESKVGRLEIDVANLEARLEVESAPPVAEPAEEQQYPATGGRDFSTDWARWSVESDGALVFTSNAMTQWRKCSYQNFEQMREALDLLAALAKTWREQKAKVGTSLVSWIGDQTSLTYAPEDEPLRIRRLHEFTFEGQTWDRQPHIKLVDNTSPDRVGRIYFAIDSERYRWIVDYVGLKLYGL
ncbi:hypothetical protein [Kitasatospora cineracea]|uniref:Uncharacterized protein n=1 Tax=Kitasatospora cineracea TaxID=88074 RepID=A0A8G1UFB3_9ACTN|nr:hypothetical protein [Kitasatospora cineracea]ROR42898.1 hypothetical protein EDD39_1031 [Kitasatospora cineracea]